MPVSSCLRLFLLGLILLTGLLSAIHGQRVNHGDSTAVGLPIDVPFEPQTMGSSTGGEHQAIVDLKLSPGAPVRLLISSLGPAGQFADATASVEEFRETPRFTPRPLSPVTSESPPDSVTRKPTIPGPNLLKTDRFPKPTATNRDFWIHVTADPLESQRGYQLIKADLLCFRESVQVYIDRNVSRQANVIAQAEQIAELLDQDVLPAIQENVGQILHVDGDRRLSVLITPWLGRLRGGTTQVKGFVRGTDFRTDLDAPFSNHAAILYLNTDLPHGSGLKTLLLHEVAHAAIFSQKSNNANRAVSIDDWLNEGFAHLCERRLGGDWSNLDYRIARYYQSPESTPLLVADYYRSNRWRDHACRGAALLFLDHHFQERPTQDQFALQNFAKWSQLGHQKDEFEPAFRDWTVSLARTVSGMGAPGKVGRYLNSGPRFHVWNVTEQGDFPFRVIGTGTKFVELRSSHVGWFRLKLPGNTLDNRWQITLLRPEPGLPEVTLQAQWEQSGSQDTKDSNSNRLSVSLSHSLPPGWHWETLGVEQTKGDISGVRNWLISELDAASPKRLSPQGHGRSFSVSVGTEQGSANQILKARLRGPGERIAWVWCNVPVLNETEIATRNSNSVR